MKCHPFPEVAPTIMVVGLGHLGGAVLESSATQVGWGRIIGCCRRSAHGEARCNLARVAAAAQSQGAVPRVDFVPLDLRDTDAVAEVIHREAPDLILNTASLQTWWLPDLLPSEAAGRLGKVGFGIWLPVHLSLTLRFMQALHAADYKGVSLTASYPDVINCILARQGLAPTAGVGNVDEIVLKIRLLAASRLGVEADRVRVLLVAHHALQRAVFRRAGEDIGDVPPYFLRIEFEERDVSRQVDADALLIEPYPLPPGPAWRLLTASSTVRLARALLAESATLVHAPGPGGLPGGYPVWAGGGQVEPAPIEGLSLQEAVAINEESHRFDGIERIDDDGTAVFTGEAATVMREQLGYDCECLIPAEAEERGAELVARFRKYAAACGVDLERASMQSPE